MKTRRLFLLVSIALALSSPRLAWADDFESLPPRVVVKTQSEAIRLAGTEVLPVKGTGSMKPYIPESEDPDKVVAILAIEKPPYEELKKGDLVVFTSKDSQVVHQIAAAQGDKWITSGLDNSNYDGPALTRETYFGRVARVYVIDPNAPATPPEKIKPEN